MKLSSYVSSIVKTDKELATDQAPLRAQEMQKTLELRMIRLQAELAKQTAAIAKLTSAYPLNFDALQASLDEVALAERSLAQLKEIGDQLFPA